MNLVSRKLLDQLDTVDSAGRLSMALCGIQSATILAMCFGDCGK